jgi:hypothetical protein
MITLLAGCLAATACGGSSSKPTAGTDTATESAATAATSPHAANGHGATGGSSSGSPGGGNGGTSAPSTGNGAGGGSNSGSSNPANPPHKSESHYSSKFSPAMIAALKNFANCARSHGVPIPEPNFSGHGEVFNSKGINPNNPQYQSAVRACEVYILAFFRAGGAKVAGASP